MPGGNPAPGPPPGVGTPGTKPGVGTPGMKPPGMDGVRKGENGPSALQEYMDISLSY
ncbi:hypothetical protein [Paenibacillus sp.]|uniref:hypothetical protein n=1 Tax=Paenibacillus sp. TaxID=58172 RepID=UPI0028200BDC|nr:hypothetical protein [Paenibacillus sp.]MDR0270535.1 hypothetical protein [Paenibacillus sp.]